MLDQHVLVLNQNYEPLDVCSARRAIILLFLGKAEIVERRDQLVRSVSRVYPLPSVVRLGLFISRPRRKILLTRKNIIKRDVHRCQYCGSTRRPMTVDHVVPKKLGGKDSWENLVCACISCNNKKGNRTPEQAKMKLLHPPRRPNHLTFIRYFIGVSDHRWRPYLFMD